ncbi:MAG: acetyltransferase [Deltaproteobacteria bacterium]|nr:acetyltransferase [Deltaproteobacteria bacterium]
MMHFDIFNGDADGIFALHQIRLSRPRPSASLITGVKRDITLLSRVADRKNCSLSVFDISLDSNRHFLEQILCNNNSVEYFDHHFAGSIPQSPLLKHTIDVSADTCTSLLVNSTLDNRSASWAICGAFGDNLHKQAQQLADEIGLTGPQTLQLQEMGELFNYNGYGATIEDLHFHPEKLYRTIRPFEDPFDFFSSSPLLNTLRQGFNSDLAMALKQKEYPVKGRNRVYLFPSSPWARRIQGVFSNLKAREETTAAHALIVENEDLTLRVSLRAPLADRRDADTLCKLFPTGGGRAAAAGINSMPASMFSEFLDRLNLTYP